MIERIRFFSSATLLLFCLGAQAASESALHVIPVAAHLTGANGTQWRTDLWIHNPGDVPVEVELALVRSAASSSEAPSILEPDGAEPIVVGSGETRTFEDVLDDGTGSATSGSLIVSGTAPLVVSSRTYSVASDGGTFGQAVPPAAILASEGASASTVPGIANNGRFRSNLGFFAAAAGDGLEIEIITVHPSGTTAGTQSIRIDGAGFSHRQVPLLPGIEFGSARIRILQGEGIVIPYASVVDNRSADAVLLSGSVISSAPGSNVSMMRSLLSAATR